MLDCLSASSINSRRRTGRTCSEQRAGSLSSFESNFPDLLNPSTKTQQSSPRTTSSPFATDYRLGDETEAKTYRPEMMDVRAVRVGATDCAWDWLELYL